MNFYLKLIRGEIRSSIDFQIRSFSSEIHVHLTPMEFFNSMEPVLRSFWFIAIPTSTIFIIQTILTFIGSDSGDGHDLDMDSSSDGGEMPFQLFTLRNLINFLLGLSWTGISFYSTVPNKTVLIGLAFVVGLLFVYVFFLIISQVQKLAEDNSFQFSNTLHKTAEVYLTIPEGKKGKILISVNGAFHELEAMSVGGTIATGEIVKVVRIENGNLLIVEKVINSENNNKL